jgi:predicted RNase H-like HicB family nuclease
MKNELTAIIERDDDWFIGYCAETPGANGFGRTAEECRASLADAIALILEDRREDALRGVPLTRSARRLLSVEGQHTSSAFAETKKPAVLSRAFSL